MLSNHNAEGDTSPSITIQKPINEFKPYDINLDIDIQKYIYDQSLQNNYSPELILAIIQHESKFKIDCISSTNDYGLGAINSVMLSYCMKLYPDKDWKNPYDNIDFIIACLNYFRDRILTKYPDISQEQLAEDLVSIYNTGEIQYFKGYINKDYVEKVYNIKCRLEQNGGI